MAYQNLNQYVYNKWFLRPVQEVSDLTLTSDERQYNEEVIFSPYLIGEFDGNVMPVKIDLNFSGSSQGFNLNYGEYNDENIVLSSNYYNIDGVTFDCFSSHTICDIGLTGTDNGLVTCMSGESIQYTMGLLPELEMFDRLKFDRRFKMFQPTGYTWTPNQRFSGLTDGIDYEMVSKTDVNIGKYNELYGGFYQGFYKLFGYDYEVLPTRYPKGWTVELTLKPRFENEYTPSSGHTTLNQFYPNNSGIFFYMGTRAENKFWHWANGTNSGDTSYERVTTPLTGLSTCMCTDLNPGYTTVTNSTVDIRSTGSTIIVDKNLLWEPNDDILVYHQELEYVTGTVINYSADSGSLTFQITKSVGVGTFPAWRVDKPNYLEYVASNCTLVYPKSGTTDYHNTSYCGCCYPPPPPPIPEHNPLFDSMSNALAVRFSGDPQNPKICVRTLTFTGECATTGSCQTTGFESVTGYSVNNYCSTRRIYDDCLGTDYTDQEHWVLVDVVFERYSWFDFCDLYYRGGLGTISTILYTATTANNSVSLIQPPLTHDQLRAKREEFVQLNYQWLIEEFYRRGKLKLYVNGRHFETFDNFEEIIPRGLFSHKETQVGVPFNISWGGGTQGLHENLVFSAMPETLCGEYIQDPELFPDNILSGTSLSGLSTNIVLEKYFAGTFDGGISTFHMYAKPLSVPEIQHNARILYNKYDLLNPYCLDCGVSVTPTPTPTPVTPTPTPSITPTNTVTPSITPTNTVTPSITPTNTVTPSITPTITLTPSITPTITLTPSVTPTISTTPTQTPTNTPTQSVTPTQTPTVSLTSSNTPTPSVTPTITPSILPPDPTPSQTQTQTPTATSTVTPTTTSTPTPTPTTSSVPVAKALIFIESSDDVTDPVGNPNTDLLAYMIANGASNWFGFQVSGVPNFPSDVNDFLLWMDWPGFVVGTTNNTNGTLESSIPQTSGGLDSFGNVIEAYNFLTTVIPANSVTGQAWYIVLSPPSLMNNSTYKSISISYNDAPQSLVNYNTETTILSTNIVYTGSNWFNTTYRVYTSSQNNGFTNGIQGVLDTTNNFFKGGTLN